MCILIAKLCVGECDLRVNRLLPFVCQCDGQDTSCKADTTSFFSMSHDYFHVDQPRHIDLLNAPPMASQSHSEVIGVRHLTPDDGPCAWR